MKIGVIQASSVSNKNELLYKTVKQNTKKHEVINFGCFDNEDNYSYIDISIEIGLLLATKSIDFIVTGCSSGQGMMLACNNMPGVICGYAPTPMDAYLFAQINNGNAISLPLGELYTYSGEDNCIKTIEKLFSEPFGQGYPKNESERKLKDTNLLKDIKEKSHINICDLLERIDKETLKKALSRKNVIEYIFKNGKDNLILEFIKRNY